MSVPPRDRSHYRSFYGIEATVGDDEADPVVKLHADHRFPAERQALGVRLMNKVLAAAGLEVVKRG